MDGAFVVNGNGIVKSAATYLDAPVRDSPLRAGFGARHMAALGATVGPVQLQWSCPLRLASISVFQDGRLILELEKVEANVEAIEHCKLLVCTLRDVPILRSRQADR